ncbi:flippase-like domain-containing protein [candidate division KSB1 bacterium]|nr:flippase-like domain-containing protein [candidate division KSB1 bacterium]
MKNTGNVIKLVIGLVIAAGFLVWTLWNVDFGQLVGAFGRVKVWYLVLMVCIIFFSHWLRCWRWKILLAPVKMTRMKNLFSSLMIGYMANTFMPAHLGEFVRAYLIGRNESMPASLAFSTIVLERIIDMLSLLVLMAFAIVLYPFPGWLKNGGYIMFAGTLALSVFLVLLKLNAEKTSKWIDLFIKAFPEKFKEKVHAILCSFVSGLNPFVHWSHYIWTIMLSIAIWLCYGIVFYLGFFAFDLGAYNLSALTALVLLVITTIGVVVPSSPGYVGTYHKLCQLGLELFNVPETPSAAFAVVLHALNFMPILFVGLFFAYKEGISLKSLSTRENLQDSL